MSKLCVCVCVCVCVFVCVYVCDRRDGHIWRLSMEWGLKHCVHYAIILDMSAF